jgi:hypothetical protein
MGTGCGPIGAFRQVTGRGLDVEWKKGRKWHFSGLTRGHSDIVRSRFTFP